MERLLSHPVNFHSEVVSPRIYVIARPTLTNEYRSFLLDEAADWRIDPDATDAELLIEFAGRICYKSFGAQQSPKSNREYIRHLISQGHESVLEHAAWSFVLSGVSRAFTHQLVRHRVGFAFSQLSQQYHEEGEANFIQPAGLENHPAALEAWKQATQNALQAYRSILSSFEKSFSGNADIHSKKEVLRATRSAARSVLPNATETVITVTANARAIRHFLKVRGSIEGDHEMRCVSSLILNSIKDDAPSVFSDFEGSYLPDNSPIVLHSEKKSAV